MHIYYQVCIAAKLEDVAPFVLIHSTERGNQEIPPPGSIVHLDVKRGLITRKVELEILDHKLNSYEASKATGPHVVILSKTELTEKDNRTLVRSHWDISARSWYFKPLLSFLSPAFKKKIRVQNQNLRKRFSSNTPLPKDQIRASSAGLPASLVGIVTWIGLVILFAFCFRLTDTQDLKPKVFSAHPK